jgi:outer membrane receptor protein involved in Fe transport
VALALLFAAPAYGQDDNGEVDVVSAWEQDPTANLHRAYGQDLIRGPQLTLWEELNRWIPGLLIGETATGLAGVDPAHGGWVSLRGSGGLPAGRNLVIVDGVPDIDGVTGSPHPDLLPRALIDNISVLPGGDSLRYGTNAMTGVIDARTRFRTLPGTEGGVAVQYGTLHTFLVEPWVLSSDGRKHFGATAWARGTQGAQDASGSALVGGTVAGRLDLNPHTKFTARARASHQETGIDRSISASGTGPEYTSDRGQGSVTVETGTANVRFRGVAWAQGGATRRDRGLNVDDLHTGVTGEASWSIASPLGITAGASGELFGGAARDVSDGIPIAMPPTGQFSAWTEFLVEPPGPALFLVGGRLVVTGEEPVRLPFKVGAVSKLWPGGQLRVRYVDNYRLPTLSERFLVEAANPELTSEGWSTGEAVLKQEFSEVLKLRLAGYRSQGRRLVVTGANGELNNGGEALVYGVELSGQGRPIRELRWMASGTLQGNGDDLRLQPTVLASGGVIVTVDRFEARAEARFAGGLRAGQGKTEPLPDLWLLDLRVQQEFPKANMALSLATRNLLNRRHYVSVEDVVPRFGLNLGLELRK